MEVQTENNRMWHSHKQMTTGVHTNSGVLNHWFYILTIGKSGTNDIGNSYNVTGINIDKAAKIAYRLESLFVC
jgi:Zn-dependent metalloprotease